MGTFCDSPSTKCENENAETDREAARLEERDLILACQAGDREAFERLYRRHARDVYSLALRMARNAPDAEEITQEVFLSVFRTIGGFRFDSAFSTWLYRIVMRRAADLFRKKKRSDDKNVSIEPHYPDGTELPLTATDANPREEAVEAQRQEKLEEAIGTLSESYRSILVLRYIHHQSYDEIAEILGCRLGTVKSRLNRAHKLLETALKESGIE